MFIDTERASDKDDGSIGAFPLAVKILRGTVDLGGWQGKVQLVCDARGSGYCLFCFSPSPNSESSGV